MNKIFVGGECNS